MRQKSRFLIIKRKSSRESTKNPIPPQPKVPSSNPPSIPGPSGGPASPSGGPSGGPSDGTPSSPSQDVGSGIPETTAVISDAIKETSEIINVLAIEPVVEIVKTTVKAIKKVIDNPKVEKANRRQLRPRLFSLARPMWRLV